MRLLLAVLLVAVVAARDGKLEDAAVRAKYVQKAQQMVTSTKTKTAGFASTIKSTCDTEIQSLKDTIAEAMKIGGNDLTQQKQKLADALEGRVAGLDALIAALKKFEANLQQHVARTNSIYENRYKQYSEDMATASLLLKEMGLLVQEPAQPGLKKITLANYQSYAAFGSNATAPIPDAPGAAASTGEATGAGSAVQTGAVAQGQQRFRGLKSQVVAKAPALLELSTKLTFKQLMQHMARQGKTPGECTTAWDASFTLYKATYAEHTKNDDTFEKERIALNRYLKLLRDLIAKKLAKRKKLAEQLTALKKLMGQPEDNVGEKIAAALREHQTLITNACPQMAEAEKITTAKFDAVVGMMTTCSKANFQDGAKAVSGAAAASTPDPTPAGASGGNVLVSGTVTHVPGESGTGNMEPMDVVPVIPGAKATVALPNAQGQ
jgi:hypothetical protein